MTVHEPGPRFATGGTRSPQSADAAGGAARRPLRVGTHLIAEAGSAGNPAYSVTLPRTAESARDARRLVSSALGCWGLDEIEDVAWLVVSELVANAVTHARRESIRVTVGRQDLLLVRLAVTDLSRVLPQARQATGQDESGRGLAMVAAVTGGRWGAERRTWGKTVWAELAATGGAGT
jgi:anti-sigma regulatory factor (Ser/Thr protein kinase)